MYRPISYLQYLACQPRVFNYGRAILVHEHSFITNSMHDRSSRTDGLSIIQYNTSKKATHRFCPGGMGQTDGQTDVFIYECAYDCAQLQYIMQHRTVLIIFTLIQTTIPNYAATAQPRRACAESNFRRQRSFTCNTCNIISFSVVYDEQERDIALRCRIDKKEIVQRVDACILHDIWAIASRYSVDSDSEPIRYYAGNRRQAAMGFTWVRV